VATHGGGSAQTGNNFDLAGIASQHRWGGGVGLWSPFRPFQKLAPMDRIA
jgi:hypothetical protein